MHASWPAVWEPDVSLRNLGQEPFSSPAHSGDSLSQPAFCSRSCVWWSGFHLTVFLSSLDGSTKTEKGQVTQLHEKMTASCTTSDTLKGLRLFVLHFLENHQVPKVYLNKPTRNAYFLDQQWAVVFLSQSVDLRHSDCLSLCPAHPF